MRTCGCTTSRGTAARGSPSIRRAADLSGRLTAVTSSTRGARSATRTCTGFPPMAPPRPSRCWWRRTTSGPVTSRPTAARCCFAPEAEGRSARSVSCRSGGERAAVGAEWPRAILSERHQDDGGRDRPAPHVHRERPAPAVRGQLPERSRVSHLRRDAGRAELRVGTIPQADGRLHRGLELVRPVASALKAGPDPLPAAPFPQRHDHPAEPAGCVAPVALHRPPRPLRAPRLDLLHDLLVLLDRAGDLVYQRAGVQPHVALRLRLDR